MLKNGCSISCLSGNATEYSGAMGRRLLPSLVGDGGGGGSCATTIMRTLNTIVERLSNDFCANDILGLEAAICPNRSGWLSSSRYR